MLNKQWCTLKFAHSLLDISFGFRVTFCTLIVRTGPTGAMWPSSSPRTQLCGRLWSRTQLPADPCSQLNSHPVPVTQTPLRYYTTRLILSLTLTNAAFIWWKNCSIMNYYNNLKYCFLFENIFKCNYSCDIKLFSMLVLQLFNFMVFPHSNWIKLSRRDLALTMLL